MTVDFASSPYFDDYDPNKNYYKILFRAGVSVQARELTQLQTMLQTQIERHGSHVFKEGAKVFGSEFIYSPGLASVKIQETFGLNFVEDIAEELVGKEVVGATSGVRANVLAFTPATSSDPLTLYISYTQTGNDRVTSVFSDSEALISPEVVGTYNAGEEVARTFASDATAVGLGCTITEGVYYVKGHFVFLNEQFHVVSKYTSDVDKRIGLTVNEIIVTSAEDESLLDNAGGTTNFAARGADRFSINLDLTSYDYTDTPVDFIELERTRDGDLQAKTKTTPYNELGRNLADRTFDINGNFVISPFKVKMREALNDYKNEGIYQSGDTSDSGNVISNDDFAVSQISEGEAYVFGYEITSTGSQFVDIEKPRTTNTVINSALPVEIGNYVRVENVHSIPDIVGDAGDINDYSVLKLYDTFTSTPGASSSGNLVGLARIRSFEFDSGSSDATVDAFSSAEKFKAYLFDIKMYQKFTLSGTPATNHVADGTKIIGATSGAFGYVSSDSSSSTVYLTSVSGNFIENEELLSHNSDSGSVENSGGTNLTISSIEKYSFDQVKQLYSNHPTSVDFTADLVLEGQFTLTGTAGTSGSSTTVTSYNGKLESELRIGDIIDIAGFEREVTGVSATTFTVSQAVNAPVAAVVRKRAFINEQSRNLSIKQLAKPFISTLEPQGSSNSEFRFRKQFNGSTNASGEITLSGGSSTFEPKNNKNYQIVVLVAGDGAQAISAGETVNIDSDEILFSSTGQTTLTIGSGSLFGNNAQLRVIATLYEDNSLSKPKSSNVGSRTKVLNKKSDTGLRPWGTSAHHGEISLGVADVYKLRAVYDSGSDSIDAEVPTVELSSISGSFSVNDVITGQSSGASALILTSSSPFKYVLLSEIGFDLDESVENSTGGSGTVNVLNAGSKLITSRYLLDTGQRDNYYDISKLVLKPKVAKPEGRLLVVYDYFSHGSGFYFSVDSYNSVDYKDIPYYSSTRIDPDSSNKSGVFDLRSALDYRPRVADVGTVSSSVRTVDEPSFNFEARTYTGVGSSDAPTPADNTLFRYDYEHYLGRIDSLFLTTSGEWVVAKGEPSENPIKPDELANSMLISDIFMNPYVLDIEEDIEIRQVYQKRYRMEDISRIEKRIDNIEYYTSLSLLESSVENLQIKDDQGLDRFKSGFLVDNFEGHQIGDAINQDYRCAIDMQNSILRGKYISKNVPLEEKDVGNTGYVVNDNIVTLDYVNVETVGQSYATTVESLTPLLSASWNGNIKLSPSADEWFEFDYAPDVTSNIEGNFNAVLAANNNAIGTVWGATQTTWTGLASQRTTSFTNREWRKENATTSRAFLQDFRRTISTFNTRGTQEGIRTSIIPRVDTKFDSERVITEDIVPFMRSRQVIFQGNGFKPFTRVYPFFDNVNVTKYVQALGGSVYGDQTDVAVDSSGAWSNLRRVFLHGYHCNDKVSNETTMIVEYSTDNITWVEANRRSYNSETSPVEVATNFDGLAITPDVVTGELYIRLRWENPDEMAFDLVEFYDQSSNLISRKYYQVESFDGWLRAGKTLNTAGRDRNSKAEVLLSVAKDRAQAGKDVSITYKIINGPKTAVPTSGTQRVFDNELVDDTALITNALGEVSGIFTIPDPKQVGNPAFRTGSRTLRLTSNPSNGDAGVTTAGESIYVANGILKVKEKTFTATRNGEIRRDSVTRNVTGQIQRTNTRLVDTRSTQMFRSRWRDPLAQSFQITTPNGEFLTKVDAYFQAKDNFIPVQLELREMENGQPTSRVIPGSTVMLPAEKVFISSNGSIPTTFTFNHPVYVKEGVELALVLISDSEDYRVFISKLGEADIVDGSIVSRQPYLGVLFKSQNSSTWTAYDNEDLKFTIYRAKFDTSAPPSTLTMIGSGVEYSSLPEDPIQCFAGSNILKISQPNHGMHSTNDVVEIKGVTTGITAELDSSINTTATSLSFPDDARIPTSGTVFLKLIRFSADKETEEVYEIVSGTASSAAGTTTINSLTRNIESSNNTAIAFDADSTVELYQQNGIPFTEINKVHIGAIGNNTLDYYTLTISSNASEDTYIGATQAKASNNALINSIQLMLPTVNHNGTSLSITGDFTSGKSVNGNESPFVGSSLTQGLVTADMIDLELPMMVASRVNEINNMANSDSFTLNLTMDTSVDNLSPVIDLERASIVCHSNRIENIASDADVFPNDIYVSPTDPEGDSGESIYITKRVQLENPATSIKCYVDAAILAGSSVQLMYKLLRSDDSVEFDEIGWTYFNTDGSSDDLVSPSASKEEYKEYVYSADSLPEFIGFAIKLRMVGENSSTPPLIKNLRAIALAV